MELVPFTAEHLVLLNDWLSERGIPKALESDLPKDGLMFYSRSDYVAAGFLRKCEGGVCLLDSYITRPSADADLRDRALNTITLALLAIAKTNGYTKILTFSTDEHTISRAKNWGFEIVNQTIMARII